MTTKSTYRTSPRIPLSKDTEPNHVINDFNTEQKVYNQSFANTQNATNIDDPDYYKKFKLTERFGNTKIDKNHTVRNSGYDSGPGASGYPKVENNKW